ncbi:hypothetical protein B0A48_03700 [Cryoendolithus antarcticus]|uniref:DNA repair protein rad9 n=1 Tax=Cryoendolithus antarcticus TaxID=1507870 RepID=A0A1V8TGK0_9PEZI|nr:hypothetical protein B0A48_03700 [Cryoendolithus antarcticus]
MSVLSFSLSPEATAKLYECLICLAKFGESVALEARKDKLTITSLNLARTAYASFSFDAEIFFINYDLNSSSLPKGGDRFTCQLYNRALQSVFKGRMTKTYRLTYEPAEVMHALFDKASASQGWRISSRVMREYIEYFGAKTEQLNIEAQADKVVFTSFTEKIQDGNQVLKQPLETVIALHTEDFEDFHMQEDMHIIISVKDFKAIVTHAETLHTPLSAHFSFPTRPLQFSYQSEGMNCHFTLMTMGDYRAASATPNPQWISTRGSSRQPSVAPPTQMTRSASEMPPPARPATLPTSKPPSSQQQRKPLKPASQQTVAHEPEQDEESLFMPVGDDDRAWGPVADQDEEEEEMLGWDATHEARESAPYPTFRDSGRTTSSMKQQQTSGSAFSPSGLEPTQRLSQLHGMFD